MFRTVMFCAVMFAAPAAAFADPDDVRIPLGESFGTSVTFVVPSTNEGTFGVEMNGKPGRILMDSTIGLAVARTLQTGEKQELDSWELHYNRNREQLLAVEIKDGKRERPIMMRLTKRQAEELAPHVEQGAQLAETAKNLPRIRLGYVLSPTGVTKTHCERAFGDKWNDFRLSSESRIGNLRTELYSWSTDGASVSLTFQNGKLVQRSEFGLDALKK
jgi:hypothetical protein